MILQRLYELAQREHLVEEPAFSSKAVACRIDVDANGKYLGLHDLRESIELPAKSKKGKPKVVLSGGKVFPAPVRPVVWDDKAGHWKTTDPAASGKEKPAVFLADAIARVVPVLRLIEDSNQEKFQAQRSTFWRFLREALTQSGETVYEPLLVFGESLESSDELREQICQDFERHGFRISDICTLAMHHEAGRVALQNDRLRAWWRQFFNDDFARQQEGEFRGLCQVTGEIAAIGSSVKSKIAGLIPVGCRAEAFLVTGLTSADSYNLSGAQSAMVSAQGIDGFTRGLNALLANQIGTSPTRERVGGVMFVFWIRDPAESDVMDLFAPDPARVASLLDSFGSGREPGELDDDNAFYLLTLTGNSARVIVRDYLETPLPQLRRRLATWFSDLRIADLSKDAQGRPTAAFPLWLLAQATALDADHVSPDTPARLVAAAVTGGPVSDSLLVGALGRLRAEGHDAFRAPRMALIKLILRRKDIPVTETLDEQERHPAYVYGRLLAVFEQIQYAALGSVNATVVDKFYGTFSAAPALVFSRLMANSQNHLRKLRGDKPSSFVALDKLLIEVASLLPAAPPPNQFSLRDQGRFALGYYHQRAKQFEQIADRKLKASAAESSV